MKIRHGKWLALGAITLGASTTAVSACGGDDSSNGGSRDAGNDVTVSDGSRPDAGLPGEDAGVDARPDSGPPPCGVADDPDPTPKVRLVNLLLPVNPGRPVGEGDAPSIRLYANGAPVPGVDAVAPNRGAASVTKYAKLTTNDNTFSARAIGSDGGVTFQVSADALNVPAGARLTIFALGNPAQSDSTKARLLIVPDQFPAAKCDQAALRFLNADDGLDIDSFVVDHASSSAAALQLGQTSDATGLLTATGSKSVVITTSYTPLEGPTGQAPFSVPASAMAGGRGYWIISAGEPIRATDDERNQGLLILPVGDDTPATWVKRDPLVYFFHAAPPRTPAALQVQSGGKTIAINLGYAQAPTYTDLPPGSNALDFVPAAGGSPVLANQSTGVLDPGGVYLGGLLGTTGDGGAPPLQTKFWKVQPTPYFAVDTGSRVVLVNAALSTPAADVGFWALGDGGAKADPFTSVFSNIAWGAMSDPGGADFSPKGIGNKWLGAQLAAEATTNRAVHGAPDDTQWQLAVLLGDWSAPSGSANAAQLVFMSGLGNSPYDCTSVRHARALRVMRRRSSDRGRTRRRIVRHIAASGAILRRYRRCPKRSPSCRLPRREPYFYT